MPEAFKNILIIKPSSLGDIVLALPALSAMRKSFPQAKISWLVRPEFMGLLQNHPYLDDIIIFDRRLLGKAWHSGKAMRALFSLLKLLRSKKFDAIIDLQGLFRTAAIARLCGTKNRFGMANAREFASFFYTHKTVQTWECIHLVDYYIKIISNLGAEKSGVQFLIPENPQANGAVKKLLESENIDIASYAVLIPGSLHADKCWPPEKFAALADKISSKFALDIVATGTTSEKKIIEDIKAAAKTPIANLASRTTLVELTALLRQAKLVATNDTGPGHIAAALGIPLIMIFGKSNPVRIAPYHRKECTLVIDPDIRGTKLNSHDPKHHIRNISVEMVFEKICEQLTKKQLEPKSI